MSVCLFVCLLYAFYVSFLYEPYDDGDMMRTPASYVSYEVRGIAHLNTE